MASYGREVELTILSAKKIKNVNWRNGPNKPYAVVWIDPNNKCSTRVDDDGDTSPSWNERLVLPFPPDNNDDEDKLIIQIVHAGQEEDTKPLIGAASLSLRDVLKEVGFGVSFVKTLKLKRPSGRPQGKLDVTVTVLEHCYHSAPRSYHAEPYGVHHAPPQPDYGDPSAGGYLADEHSGYEHKQEKEKKESKFGGMGTGLAIGAVAGVLGGIALSQGFDAMQENITEEAAEEAEEKVDDDLPEGSSDSSDSSDSGSDDSD